jgi:hypothetical protein
MDFKHSKETTDNEAPAQEKGRQTGMLVLLLVLLGGFGYLYFFTGLIRPQEQPPAPQPPPQIVKQPLPVRDAVIPGAAKPAVPNVPAVPLPAAPVAPVAKLPQKTADAKAAAVPAVKTPEPVKPAGAVAKAEPKKVLPVKAVEKPIAAAREPQLKQAEPARKKVAVVKPGGPWTVVVGLYVVEETLASDIAKIKKTGLTPVMTSGPKRAVAMNRLLYGDYPSKQDAQQALEKLQRAGGSGFLVQRGAMHEVYAGSYAVLSGALSEQQRLEAAGVKVTIKKVQVPLASRKLTAGTFTDRKAADGALKKLKVAGIGTPVLE